MSARRGTGRRLKTDMEEKHEDAAKLYASAYDEGVTELENRGVDLSVEAPTQDFTGSIPTNLPDLDSRELGDLLGQCTEWFNYVSRLMALVDAKRTTLDQALRTAEAEVRRELTRSSETKKYEKDDMVRLDTRVVALRYEYLRAEVQHILLSRSIVPSSEKGYSAVSREVSRRDQEQHQHTRGGAVGRRRKQR